MPEGIEDPFSAVAEGAVQMHELYTAYMDAGFPEARAYDLVKTLLVMTCSSDDD
jgi:hypothetical protein